MAINHENNGSINQDMHRSLGKTQGVLWVNLHQQEQNQTSLQRVTPAEFSGFPMANFSPSASQSTRTGERLQDYPDPKMLLLRTWALNCLFHLSQAILFSGQRTYSCRNTLKWDFTKIHDCGYPGDLLYVHWDLQWAIPAPSRVMELNIHTPELLLSSALLQYAEQDGLLKPQTFFQLVNHSESLLEFCSVMSDSSCGVNVWLAQSDDVLVICQSCNQNRQVHITLEVCPLHIQNISATSYAIN